jgi:hypothetical protein
MQKGDCKSHHRPRLNLAIFVEMSPMTSSQLHCGHHSFSADLELLSEGKNETQPRRIFDHTCIGRTIATTVAALISASVFAHKSVHRPPTKSTAADMYNARIMQSRRRTMPDRNDARKERCPKGTIPLKAGRRPTGRQSPRGTVATPLRSL